MRLLLFVLFLLSTTLLQANENIEYPTLANRAKNAKAFVPNGWKLIADTKGDLNKDGADDLIFIIESEKEYSSNLDEGRMYSPRVVGIAIWIPLENIFELKVQANDFIPTTEGNPAITDDPLESILIKGGTARFYFHYMDNSKMYITDQTFVFYYNENQFKLAGYVRSKLHRSTQAYTRESLNYVTGTATLQKRSNDGEIGADSDAKFEEKQKITLANIGKAKDFKPQELKYSEFVGAY